MATLRDLPQEIFDMIVARVPRVGYILVLEYVDSNFPTELDGLGKEIIARYSTLELAKDAGRMIMKRKARDVECMEKRVDDLIKAHRSASQRCNVERYHDLIEEEKVDGTMTWILEAPHTKQWYRLSIQKLAIRDEIGDVKAMRIPVINTPLRHRKKCRCSEESDGEHMHEREGEDHIKEGFEEDAEELIEEYGSKPLGSGIHWF